MQESQWIEHLAAMKRKQSKKPSFGPRPITSWSGYRNILRIKKLREPVQRRTLAFQAPSGFCSDENRCNPSVESFRIPNIETVTTSLHPLKDLGEMLRLLVKFDGKTSASPIKIMLSTLLDFLILIKQSLLDEQCLWSEPVRISEQLVDPNDSLRYFRDSLGNPASISWKQGFTFTHEVLDVDDLLEWLELTMSKTSQMLNGAQSPFAGSRNTTTHKMTNKTSNKGEESKSAFNRVFNKSHDRDELSYLQKKRKNPRFTDYDDDDETKNLYIPGRSNASFPQGSPEYF